MLEVSRALRANVLLEDLRQPGEDNRVRRIRTARKAKGAVKALEGRLASVFPRPVRRRVTSAGLPVLPLGSEPEI